MAQSSDKQKAVLALSITSQTCTTALNAITSPTSLSSNHFSDAPSSTATPPPLDTLHSDLVSILKIVSHSVTKLALLLKPSGPPAYSASVPVLTDLTSRISDIAGCTALFGLHRNTYGEHLVKEINQLVEDIVYNMRSLLQAYLHLASDSTGRRISVPSVAGIMDFEQLLGGGSSKDEYLRLTGTIHELIDEATGAPTSNGQSTKSTGKRKAVPVGLSRNNTEAVQKLWVRDGGNVKDGVRELKEMIEDYHDEDRDANVVEDEGSGDDEDGGDGWAELGVGTGKLKKAEVERAKQVLPLLNLTTTLHTHIPALFVSAAPTSASKSMPILPNSSLSRLPPLSSSLLSVSDDLIATLYSPQNPESIADGVRALVKVVKELEAVFSPIYGSLLERDMAQMTIEGEEDKEQKRRELLMKMFVRVYNVARDIEEGLRAQDEASTLST